MILTDFSIIKPLGCVKTSYRLFLAAEHRAVEAQFTPFVGSLMTAAAMGLRQLAGSDRATTPLEGSFHLTRCEVEELSEVAWPLKWRVILESGPYHYEATVDQEPEHLILLLEGAMKFFALKYRLVTVEPDVVTNRGVAAQHGMLTREDG